MPSPANPRNLEEQIQSTLGTLGIDDAFRDWALAQGRKLHAREAGEQGAIARSLAETRKELERRTASLLDLRLRGLISDDEYTAKKQELGTETLRLRERERDGSGQEAPWFEPLQKTLLFANQAPKRFAVAQRDEKRDILMSLGSNLMLKDRMCESNYKNPSPCLSKDLGVTLGTGS